MPSEIHRLTRVVLKHPREAFIDAATIARQWKELHFTAPPDLAHAADEYERLMELIRRSGAEIVFLPQDEHTGLDSIYVRDASVACARGVILARMGKALRSGEPAAQETALRRLGIPVAGMIHEPGHLEGGDVVWLDHRTVAVGRGYRTDDEGIRQFHALLGDSIDELVVVPLPHWRGADDVMHLMSLISPVDIDLAVVHSPLLPVPFRARLLDKGYSFVEVPDEEFETMGTNVLAIAPRQCVMVSGNPRTRAALQRAGAEVFEYEGQEISVKGAGGPTCLTRPLERRF